MNRKQHIVIGATAGTAFNFFTATKENRQPTLAELFGSGVGGACGARVPDVLEPAIHPNHRKMAHSGAALVGCIGLTKSRPLTNAVTWLHQQAAARRALMKLDPEREFIHQLAAWLLEFLAGMIQALPVGYASHLVADATTVKGIPLF